MTVHQHEGDVCSLSSSGRKIAKSSKKGSPRCHFVPLEVIWQSLEILCYEVGRCCWHLVAASEECSWTSYGAQDTPAAEKDLVQMSVVPRFWLPGEEGAGREELLLGKSDRCHSGCAKGYHRSEASSEGQLLWNCACREPPAPPAVIPRARHWSGAMERGGPLPLPGLAATGSELVLGPNLEPLEGHR